MLARGPKGGRRGAPFGPSRGRRPHGSGDGLDCPLSTIRVCARRRAPRRHRRSRRAPPRGFARGRARGRRGRARRGSHARDDPRRRVPRGRRGHPPSAGRDPPRGLDGRVVVRARGEVAAARGRALRALQRRRIQGVAGERSAERRLRPRSTRAAAHGRGCVRGEERVRRGHVGVRSRPRRSRGDGAPAARRPERVLRDPLAARGAKLRRHRAQDHLRRAGRARPPPHRLGARRGAAPLALDGASRRSAAGDIRAGARAVAAASRRLAFRPGGFGEERPSSRSFGPRASPARRRSWSRRSARGSGRGPCGTL